MVSICPLPRAGCVSCDVTRSPHKDVLEIKRVVAMPPSFLEDRNSSQRSGCGNQLQSVKVVEIGNRECEETIARVW